MTLADILVTIGRQKASSTD